MLRLLNTVVVAVLALGLGTSCSNGGSGPTSANAGACNTGAGAFCLAACNLGCSPNGGCSITDIAPNQPIEFRFSQVVDPASVDSSSISIRTASGQEPIGALVVDGDRVTFRPEVRFVQGATFFGFTTNETYTVTIAGGPGAPNAIASTSGDRLDDRFVCTLRVTLDVVDVDASPPRATLVSPTTTNLASRDSIFTLEFSEIIDFAPFFNVPAEQQPIRYRIRRNLTNAMGERECDPASAGTQLSGVPRLSNDLERGISIATFTPFETLPGDTCVEIEVTNLVRDLSGRRAAREFFRITLDADQLQPRVREFDFEDDQLLDAESSGGSWGNFEASFAQVGGDGRHGVFDHQDGDEIEPGVFLFSTEDQEITGYPANPEAFVPGVDRVRDGVFYFSRMEIPVGVTVLFRGPNPARIFVRGQCSILGRLSVSGESTEDGFNGDVATGQPGGIAGASGGDGGDGAFRGTNDGNASQPNFNDFNGFDGGDVSVPMGHAYEMMVAGTGGPGGLLHPPGNDLSVVSANPPPAIFPTQTDYIGGWAGGGGFATAGGIGSVVRAQTVFTTGNSPDFRGPDAAAGTEFTPFVTLGRPMGVTSLDYYVVGGSGGGGGGSNPFASALVAPRYWAGGGGGAGGGAVGLFVGNSLSIEALGAIEARGGSAGAHNQNVTALGGAPAGGGGGSGGSILIQVENSLQVLGALDVRGGLGAADLADETNGAGCTPGVPCLGVLEANGGDGGEGFLRVEQVGAVPSLSLFGNAQPAATAANVGELEDPNPLSGFMSLFVSTNEVFSPTFSRYVIEADVNGTPMTFSDDPNVGTPAIEGEALRFYVQGTDIDILSGQPPVGSTPLPWRRFVGVSLTGEPTLNSDAPLGFRFALIRDSSVSADVVVRSVRIEFQS